MHCLPHPEGDSSSQFRKVMFTLTTLATSSVYWITVICSSAVLHPIFEFRVRSGHYCLEVAPVPLTRPKLNGIDVFAEFDQVLPTQQLDLLIDYMGGFPRALATLLEVLHNTKDVGKPFTFEVVLRAVVSELHVVYPSISVHLPAMIEAFMAVIRRDDVTNLTKFGDASFDEAFSCGLLRLNIDERLECPYVLYLLLDSLPNRWDELENHAPRELRGDWKPWVSWNEFYDTFRMLKSLAWADRKDRVGWWQLHRGAYMTSYCQQWVKETRRSIALGTTTTQNITKSGLASDRVYQLPCGDLIVCMEVMNTRRSQARPEY